MVIFGPLLSLTVPIAVIVGIVLLIRRVRDADEHEDDEGIGTVRRVFIYGLALVSLIFAGVGVSMLLGGVLEALAGDRVIADSDADLAIALSFTVVGVPAWVIFAALAQRAVNQHPSEGRAHLRWLYLGLARGIAISVALGQGATALPVVFGTGEFDGGSWGWALTWLAIWVLHELLVRSAPATTYGSRFFDRLYRYFAAVVGLFMFGMGLIATLTIPALRAYDAIAADPLMVRGGWHVGEAISVGLLGGLAWGYHWLVGVRRDAPSTLWDTYVFLFGVLTGVAASVGAAGTILYIALQWLIGDPGETTAAAHFRDTIPAAGFLLVGAASWMYHRLVLDEEREARGGLPRSEPERVYRYLVAAAGLVTLAVGLTTLFALVVDVLTPEGAGTFREAEWWRNELVTAITFLVVGAPLWVRYWFAAQRAAEAGGAAEVESPSRRVFLFGVFGVSILVALVNLVILLYEFFDSILSSSLTAQTLQDVRWSIAMLLTAGAISVYYWLVLREHQEVAERAEAERPVSVLREVILVGVADDDRLRRGLEDAGARVRTWRRADRDPVAVADDQLEALLARIGSTSRPRVMLVGGSGGIEVIPFEPE
ncbi:MAG: hypothetical protein H6675_09555 [Dehalococcoidia bacterium]|nr:hypothetical protein [Dehalococcoidia bacterium]